MGYWEAKPLRWISKTLCLVKDVSLKKYYVIRVFISMTFSKRQNCSNWDQIGGLQGLEVEDSIKEFG